MYTIFSINFPHMTMKFTCNAAIKQFEVSPGLAANSSYDDVWLQL